MEKPTTIQRAFALVAVQRCDVRAACSGAKGLPDATTAQAGGTGLMNRQIAAFAR
jgi:hypothetical protein